MRRQENGVTGVDNNGMTLNCWAVGGAIGRRGPTSLSATGVNPTELKALRLAQLQRELRFMKVSPAPLEVEIFTLSLLLDPDLISGLLSICALIRFLSLPPSH